MTSPIATVALGKLLKAISFTLEYGHHFCVRHFYSLSVLNPFLALGFGLKLLNLKLDCLPFLSEVCSSKLRKFKNGAKNISGISVCELKFEVLVILALLR